MTPRELMKRCIHFQSPARAGLVFDRFGVNDTVNVFDFFLKDEHGTDPWGTTFVVHPDVPTIGIPKETLVDTHADFAALRAPDPKAFAARVAENIARLSPEQRDKYRFIATSSGIWERVQYFRGMERVFEDMTDDPAFVHEMIDFCTDFWVAFLHELAPLRGEVDALYMFDDWGTQEDVMISPGMWDEFFAASYRRITDAAHANGMDFWLHSCGRVTKLIDHFIAAGMDVINPYQSGTCGYEEVAARFAGKVTLYTTVDTQATLAHGTPAQVRAECERLAAWGTPQGGLIVGAYLYDIPEENERVVFDYFQ
jgi:uroporphyrinogen-III decarboxylase